MVLINGAPSRFFKDYKGIGHGWALSPFLFFIIEESLWRMLKEEGLNGSLRGVKVSESEEVTRLQFIDEIFCSVQRN
jgi:hypothetical protein